MHKAPFTLGLLALGAFGLYQTRAIALREYTVRHEKIPPSFDGFRVLHLSDVHSRGFWREIRARAASLSPDIIVITGDLISRSKLDIDGALAVVGSLPRIAPTYYVTGNHEAGIGAEPLSALTGQLRKAGVQPLRNQTVTVEKEAQSIRLSGVDDPVFWGSKQAWRARVRQLGRTNGEAFHLLLTHRPEELPVYRQARYDLVFAGHSHGGQICLPFGGAIIAPGQELFPRYVGGRYDEGATTMIVSRGLGTTTIPVRLFARPEVVLATLRTV